MEFFLVSMLYEWLLNSDRPDNTVRKVLFDFKEPFNLLNHKVLSLKLDISILVIRYLLSHQKLDIRFSS